MPLTEQIRHYFADVDAQLGTIDIDAVFEADPARPRALGGSGAPAPPRSRRWAGLAAAAAAVVALISGLAIVRSDGTQAPVDDGVPTGDSTIPVTSDASPAAVPTTDAAESTTTSAPTTSATAVGSIVAGVGCPFGIAGDPVVMENGPVDPRAPRFDPEPGQNIAHIVVGSQVAEVRVPGFGLETDGWTMDDIELARGPARVWLDGPPSGEQGKPFVQVRWSSDTEQTCGSFTVTVDGGTVDDNRQLAVDLAQRILLPSELGDPNLPGAQGGPVAGLELADTEWTFERASVAAGTLPGAVFTFDDGTVTWGEGCGTVRADYDLDREQGILTLTNRSWTNPGCTPPPDFNGDNGRWLEIRSVMGADRIPAAYLLDLDPVGGAVPEVEGLLRLGNPRGLHIVLAPA